MKTAGGNTGRFFISALYRQGLCVPLALYNNAMNRSSRPLVSFAVALALAGCSLFRPVTPPGVAVVNLVAINDFHGNLEASRLTYTSVADGQEHTMQAGGIDALGATLQAWRKDDPDLLLVGAGDLVGGSPAMSSMWADEPTLGALDLLGMRVSSVGNHEFDAGRTELLRLQKGGCKSPRPDKACQFDGHFNGARFNYLAANVIDMVTRKPVLPAYQIEQVQGARIGFIGAVLRDADEKALPSGIAGLEFADEANAINQAVAELRKQGVGVFVVLIHQGGRTVEPYDKKDCSQLTGPIVDVVRRLDPAIRVIISGHTHKGYTCRVDGRLVTEAELAGHMLSRIRLEIDTASNTLRSASARNEIVTPGRYPMNQALTAYLARVRGRSEEVLSRPVARVAVSPVLREQKGSDESALGNLVADALLQAGRPFGAQIAFMNSRSMRQDLSSGANLMVSAGQVQMVLPYSNTLVVMNLTGRQINAALEQQFLGGRNAGRGMLQPSDGFTYTYDPRQPEGSRIVPGSVMLRGVPLEPDSAYRVVVTNFLAEGGDAFPAFVGGSQRADTGIRDIDALTNYLVQRDQNGKPAGSSAPIGRIQRLQ